MKVLLQPANEVVEIDADDLPSFSQHRWTIVRGGATKYATCRIGRRIAYLHRFLASPPAGMVVDHRDGNGLNNTRANLRVITQQQNMWNTHRSRKPGRHGKYWNPIMRVGKRRVRLGMFPDEQTAIQAQAYVEGLLRGEFSAKAGVNLTSFDPMLLSPAIRTILSGLPNAIGERE